MLRHSLTVALRVKGNELKAVEFFFIFLLNSSSVFPIEFPTTGLYHTNRSCTLAGQMATCCSVLGEP